MTPTSIPALTTDNFGTSSAADVLPGPPLARDARLEPLPPWCTSPMRAALSELMLSGALVLAEIDSVELQNSWKKKPATARLMAALEQAREALS